MGAHFVLQNPSGLTQLQNDLLGVALNWAQAVVEGARGEYNVEIFYRLPVFPQVDMTLSYQAMIHPAQDPENDLPRCSASGSGQRSDID